MKLFNSVASAAVALAALSASAQDFGNQRWDAVDVARAAVYLNDQAQQLVWGIREWRNENPNGLDAVWGPGSMRQPDMTFYLTIVQLSAATYDLADIACDATPQGRWTMDIPGCAQFANGPRHWNLGSRSRPDFVKAGQAIQQTYNQIENAMRFYDQIWYRLTQNGQRVRLDPSGVRDGLNRFANAAQDYARIDWNRVPGDWWNGGWNRPRPPGPGPGPFPPGPGPGPFPPGPGPGPFPPGPGPGPFPPGPGPGPFPPGPGPEPLPRRFNQVFIRNIVVDQCLDLLIYADHARLALPMSPEIGDGGCRPPSTQQDAVIVQADNSRIQFSKRQDTRNFIPGVPTSALSFSGRGTATFLPDNNHPNVYGSGADAHYIVRIQDRSSQAGGYEFSFEF